MILNRRSQREKKQRSRSYTLELRTHKNEWITTLHNINVMGIHTIDPAIGPPVKQLVIEVNQIDPITKVNYDNPRRESFFIDSFEYVGSDHLTCKVEP